MIGISIIVVCIVLGVYFNTAKKKAALAENNVPIEAAMLEKNIAFYSRLDKDQKQQFENKIREFLSEIQITGVDTTVEDRDRIMVAASAVIPVFAFPQWKYYNLREVLLYSDAINTQFQTEGGDRNILGMVGTGYMEGKMLLSKFALQLGFSNASDKNNTAIHEFVHLVDKADGVTDGVPEQLLDKQYTIPWLDMVYQQMKAIQQRKSDINPYGATNKAEFFAVAGEYFFERPDLLQQKHPELFKLLQQIFKQDPGSNKDE